MSNYDIEKLEKSGKTLAGFIGSVVVGGLIWWKKSKTNECRFEDNKREEEKKKKIRWGKVDRTY